MDRTDSVEIPEVKDDYKFEFLKDPSFIDKLKEKIKAIRNKKHNDYGLEIFDDSTDRLEEELERKNIAPEEIDLSDIASVITKRDIGRKL